MKPRTSVRGDSFMDSRFRGNDMQRVIQQSRLYQIVYLLVIG